MVAFHVNREVGLLQQSLELGTRAMLVLCPSALIVWMLLDGRFPSHLLSSIMQSTTDLPRQSHFPWRQQLGNDTRATLFTLAVVVFVVSFVTVLVTFLFGSRKGRTLATLICTCTSVALWMWLLLEGSEIVYAGRVVRVQATRDSIAEYLREVDADWDRVVGSHDAKVHGKWVYTHAYPLQRPRMIMAASPIAIPNTSVSWIAIERTVGDAIRMELAGGNEGYWIELRDDDRPPQPFVGGLEERFTPKRWSKIGPKLYLVVLDRDGSVVDVDVELDPQR